MCFYKAKRVYRRCYRSSAIAKPNIGRFDGVTDLFAGKRFRQQVAYVSSLGSLQLQLTTEITCTCIPIPEYCLYKPTCTCCITTNSSHPSKSTTAAMLGEMLCSRRTLEYSRPSSKRFRASEARFSAVPSAPGQKCDRFAISTSQINTERSTRFLFFYLVSMLHRLLFMFSLFVALTVGMASQGGAQSIGAPSTFEVRK